MMAQLATNHPETLRVPSPLIRLALRAIHLLPQGEKGGPVLVQLLFPPSPLEGEGAPPGRAAPEGRLLADEGSAAANEGFPS
jgi:hypothetical protein